MSEIPLYIAWGYVIFMITAIIYFFIYTAYTFCDVFWIALTGKTYKELKKSEVKKVRDDRIIE